MVTFDLVNDIPDDEVAAALKVLKSEFTKLPEGWSLDDVDEAGAVFIVDGLPTIKDGLQIQKLLIDLGLQKKGDPT